MYGDLISRVVEYDGDLLRNIKGIRESQALFDDLADGPADLAVAIAAEARDKLPSPEPLVTRPFDYGSVITFPFVSDNWQHTRFSDGLAYGVWYGAPELETTVFETVHHWRRFILDSFPREAAQVVGERRVFGVICRGILIDLRGKEEAFPGLVAPENYAFTQPLGAYLKGQSQNGLLVRSARCTGTNAAVFRPDILSRVSDVCYLTYRMVPARGAAVTVERQAGVAWLEI